MPLSLPARFWTLTKDTRTAMCDVVAHPLGLEVRYAVRGELIRSLVFKETATVQ
jgi:hypothetical protein